MDRHGNRPIQPDRAEIGAMGQRTEKEDSRQAVDQGIYPLDRAHPCAPAQIPDEARARGRASVLARSHLRRQPAAKPEEDQDGPYNAPKRKRIMQW